MTGFLRAVLIAVVCGGTSSAQDATCNAPAQDVTSTFPLSGAPFSAIPTADGCTILVSLSGPGGHIGVFRRMSGTVTLAHDILLASAPAGMTMSHDGELLAVAAGARVLLFDVSKVVAGDGSPLASASDGVTAASVYTAFSMDDTLLFVSDEGNATVSVYNVAKLRAGVTESIGRVPVGLAPVGLAAARDGRTLYSTSELARVGPAVCGAAGSKTSQGVVSVIDVAKAAVDPMQAVVASVPAGCDPVRIALSARGDAAYVTARGDNELLVLDTGRLRTDPDHARIAALPVGLAPVGVVVAGDRVITADSNRFAGNISQEWLSVIDTAKTEQGAAAVLGSVPAGAFPRELYVTADGKTLLVTNFMSRSLELVDLSRLTSTYLSEQMNVRTSR